MLPIIKRRRKVVKNILISFVALFLLLCIATMIMIKIVYDKQFPRFDKQEFSAYLTYGDVTGYDRTLVKFKSGKNMLTGYVYGKQNDKGLVVIAHGLGGGAEEYLPETMYFVDKGWRVFSYDCTGCGESEGKGSGGLPQSAVDLDAALTYIENNSTLKGLPKMLYGHSWGGYAVTAVLNYNHPISAVASISGFNSPMEMLDEQAESMMGALAHLEHPFEWIYQTALFGRKAGLTAVDGINNVKIPVMIIHGSKDETVSYTGAGIIAHKDEITNPNVKYRTCSEKNQNGHNNLYMSEAASEYFNKINNDYKALYLKYNKKIPHDVKAEFYQGIDRHKTSERDTDFLSEINNFYEKSLNR